MKDKLKIVVDEHHHTHIIDEKIGEGGQGTVYRTKDADIAIKIAIDDNTNKKLFDKNKYDKKLNYLSLLPLPIDIKITKPIALLADEPGYVMKLLDYMVPIHNLRSDKKIEKNKNIPEWLSGVEDEKYVAELINYGDSGGLRRRLNILSKAASVLAELHASGMTYGDVSDNNVFISNRGNDSKVWLIDPDNIELYIRNNKKNVFTPKYGAPEIVQNKSGISFGSDCYSFAILAYWTLSLNHPFIGDYVVNGEGNDWDDENSEDLDEKAYSGEIPWINDPDDINRAERSGLPQDLILTNKLKAIFQKTLGEGRTNISKRRSIFHWAPSLIEASDQTIKCSNCKMHFYYDKSPNNNCPYCDSKDVNILIFSSYLTCNENKEQKYLHWKYIREFNDKTISLPYRLFYPFCNKSYDNEILSLYKRGDEVYIKKNPTFQSIEISVESEGNSSTFANTFRFKKDKLKKPLILTYKVGNNISVIKMEMIGKIN